MKYNYLILSILILVILSIILPFAFIWSINELFTNNSIPYNFDSWLASSIFLVILKNIFNSQINTLIENKNQ
jgi:hypothetical protein